MLARIIRTYAPIARVKRARVRARKRDRTIKGESEGGRGRERDPMIDTANG